MPKYIIRRVLCAVFAVLFALSTFVSSTMTWQGISQPGINNVDGSGVGKSVSLLKLIKDMEGNPTELPLPGTEFYLYQVSDPDDIQVGGRYVTDGDGKINVRLQPGDYYFLETNPAYGYTYDLEEDQEKQRYPFTVTGNETENILVTAYNREVSGYLTVTKEIVNEDMRPLTQAQLDRLFTFKIVFSDKGVYQFRIDGGDLQQLASGDTFQLKHGQEAVFENLPVGVQYTVTELNYWPYRVSSTNHQGHIVVDGTTAAFVNTLPLPGSITTTKTVSNADGSPLTQEQRDKEFTFTMKFTGDEDHPVPDPIFYRIEDGSQTGELIQLPEDGRFTLKHGEKAVFVDLPAGLEYTLKEEDPSDDGYTPSKVQYTGITVDGDVAMDTDILLPFVNSYEEDPNTTGDLDIRKTIGGAQEEIDREKEFSFIVSLSGASIPDLIQYRINGGELLTLGSDGIIKLKHGETARFEDLPQGTSYTVKEESVEGYLPTVVSDNGIILGDRTAAVDFVNNKEKTTDLIVRKEVPGEVSQGLEDMLFHFILYLDGEVYAEFDLRHGESKEFPDLPAGVTYEVQEVNVSEDHFAATVVGGYGVLHGDTVEVVWTNTYKGDILDDIDGEKTWDLGGEEVDLAESITVNIKHGDLLVGTMEVSQNEDGKWLYTFPELPKYDDEGNLIQYTIEEIPLESWRPSVDGYDLVNTYVKPTTYTPQVEKRIEGENVPIDKLFRFQMTAQDGAPMPDDAEDGIKVVGITDTGMMDFGKITFTKAGTYVYTLSELNDGLLGFIYDTSGYTLTIEAVEENNAIIIASAVLTKNGEPTDGTVAVFTNRYEEPEDDEIIVVGQKTWRHGSNPQENWPDAITVHVKDGGRIVASVIVTAETNWQWSFHLPKYRDDSSVTHYTIDEEPIPGYIKTVDGYNLVNIYDDDPKDETVTLRGTKTWVYGNAPKDDRPDQVTVIVKNGDKTVGQIQVTAANNWNWSMKLPRYDKDGDKINYTIEESNVPHYTSTIKGYDLTNTYKGDDYQGDNPGGKDSTNTGRTKTGDVSQYILWLCLMVFSLLAMFIIMIPVYRKRHRVKKLQRRMRDEEWIRKNINKRF